MTNSQAIILENSRLAENIYSTVFKTGIALGCSPGQFVMVGTKSDSRLLKRPISICESDRSRETVRLVYRAVGYGTGELSKARPGDSFELLGPLGNGFPIDKAQDKENILLIGGGIGAPPLLSLAHALRMTGIEKDKITAVLGYAGMRTGIFLNEEFTKEVRVILSSDDGSVGIRGTVMDALTERELKPDILYACGPLAMLKAVKEYASERFIPAYISLEEKMACGVGACLGCVVKTKERDDHSKVNNARVCTEGPVFEAGEVELC